MFIQDVSYIKIFIKYTYFIYTENENNKQNKKLKKNKKQRDHF